MSYQSDMKSATHTNTHTHTRLMAEATAEQHKDCSQVWNAAVLSIAMLDDYVYINGVR